MRPVVLVTFALCACAPSKVERGAPGGRDDGPRPGPAPDVRALGQDVVLECAGAGCLLWDGSAACTVAGEAVPSKGDLVGVFAADGRDWTMFARDGDVTLVGPTTVTIKAPRAAPDDPLLTPLAVGSTGLVLFDDGSMWRVAPPPHDDAPWTKLPPVVSGELSTLDAHEVVELAHGKLYRGAGSRLVSFADDSRPRFELFARDDLGLPAVCGDTVFISAAKAAYALDMVRCRSDAPVSPDEIGGNCVKARFELPETAWARPARLANMVFFLADGHIHQMVDLAKGWVAEVDGDALAIVGDATTRGATPLLLASSHCTMDHPARLVSVDPASGRVLMQIDLPGSKMSLFDVALAVTGDRVAAETSGALYTWSVDALVASSQP